MVRPAEKGNFVKRIGFYGMLAVAAVIFSFPAAANAASLYFSPIAQNVTVGQTFVVAVGVSSADQAMNAASGDISFPTSQLQVLSISKSGSIISLWVRDPTFTDSVPEGNVHFEGIVLNPGFTGTAGTIIKITFQAVGSGGATILFSGGSILANDGNGTNILTALGTAAFAISPARSESPPKSVSSSEPFATKTVSSSANAPSLPTSTPGLSGNFDGALLLLLLLVLVMLIVCLIYLVEMRRELEEIKRHQ